MGAVLLTLLQRCVPHPVRPVAQVADGALRAGAGRRSDARAHVGAAGRSESARVHGELRADVTERAWGGGQQG